MKKKVIVLVLLVLCSSAISSAADIAQQYPPYPDVWGIDIPVAKNVDYAAIRVIKMPDGDYLITYAKDWTKVKEKEEPANSGKLLFSGAVKDYKNDEYNFIFNKMRKEKRIIIKPSPITFNDGGKMKIVRDMHPKGDNPFEWYLEKKDKNGKVLIQKKLLYVYDKPIRKETPLAERNFDYNEKYYYEKAGWPEELKYFPLEDDTFLVAGFLKYQNPPSVIIVRLDKDFKTKSDLLGKKVFFVDEKIYREMKEPRHDQAVNDFFCDYLINNRKEK